MGWKGCGCLIIRTPGWLSLSTLWVGDPPASGFCGFWWEVNLIEPPFYVMPSFSVSRFFVLIQTVWLGYTWYASNWVFLLGVRWALIFIKFVFNQYLLKYFSCLFLSSLTGTLLVHSDACVSDPLYFSSFVWLSVPQVRLSPLTYLQVHRFFHEPVHIWLFYFSCTFNSRITISCFSIISAHVYSLFCIDHIL